MNYIKLVVFCGAFVVGRTLAMDAIEIERTKKRPLAPAKEPISFPEFCRAVWAGQKQTVQAVLETAPIYLLNKAVLCDCYTCVKTLLHAGVFSDWRSTNGNTLLHVALSAGIAGLLRDGGMDPTIRNHQSMTAAETAGWLGRTPVAQLLSEKQKIA
jgi:hypothetical protein